jgi:acyl-CoA thioesterase-1
MHYSLPRILVTTLIIIIALLAAIEIFRLIKLYTSVKGNKAFWEAQISKGAEPGDFIYLALGDSVAQGIGTSNVKRSYVSLIAAHIEQTTGRHVHVINLSVTGAKAADVVREQLPRMKGISPDFATLDVGANDINAKTPHDAYIRDFNTILSALPAKKSLIADLPVFGTRSKQHALDLLNTSVITAISSHQMERAAVSDFTRPTVNDLSTYAADFFHPGDKGYRNWYNAFLTKLDGITQQ